MKTKIYVVTGTSGSYGDKRTWIVAAFRDPAAAAVHMADAIKAAEKCTQWCKDACTSWDIGPICGDEPPKPENPYDPNMQIVDTEGVEYRFKVVELFEALVTSTKGNVPVDAAQAKEACVQYVDGCSTCPFAHVRRIHYGRSDWICTAGNAPLASSKTSERTQKIAPVWCPLRTKTIKVRLEKDR